MTHRLNYWQPRAPADSPPAAPPRRRPRRGRGSARGPIAAATTRKWRRAGRPAPLSQRHGATRAGAAGWGVAAGTVWRAPVAKASPPWLPPPPRFGIAVDCTGPLQRCIWQRNVFRLWHWQASIKPRFSARKVTRKAAPCALRHAQATLKWRPGQPRDGRL